MKRKFTDEDILRFLFEEMEQAESEIFLTALCADEALWERYEYFQEVVEKSSSLSFEPSEESCKNIMNYVEETNPNVKTPSEKNPYLVGLKSPRLSTNAILMFILALFGSITIIGSIYQMQKFEAQNKHADKHIDRVERLEWEDPILENKIDQVQLELEKLKRKDTQEL